MRVALFTNEFPPHIYGGAGVHVDFLSRELKKHIDLEVRCFGDQKLDEEHLSVRGVAPLGDWSGVAPQHKGVFQPLDRDLQMAAGTTGIDLVHCHTWYSHWAGFLTKTLQGVPLVLTTHSLEPHRPWKVEQLGTGYHLSCKLEQNAYRHADGVIAVSNDMKRDVVAAYGVDPEIVEVIHNGIDLDFYKPTFDEGLLRSRGIDPAKPIVLFVGRITRQKGIRHLLQAAEGIAPGAQLVFCAGAPDTPEIEREATELFQKLQANREGVFWIREMLDHKDLRVLYSHASVFVCPSLYEPFGIINLEAMACGTPVVASRVGGIPEIIVDGGTGFLVPFDSESKTNFEPRNPLEFQKKMAERINAVLADEGLRKSMGEASRKRAETHFSWTAIAAQTIAFYRRVLERAGRPQN